MNVNGSGLRSNFFQDHSPTHDILRDLYTARSPEGVPPKFVRAAVCATPQCDHEEPVPVNAT